MKKKSLRNLILNKKSISNLQSTESIVGGTGGSCYAPCPDISGPKGPCLPPPPDSLIDITGCNSANGCTSGTDETMTCADWSCGCNQ